MWDVAITACGFQAQQDTSELAAVLTEVAALNPARLLEVGCACGGTLYAWTRVCPHVYGITLPDPQFPLDAHGAMVYLGDSHDQLAREWLTGMLAGELLDVLFIDGDHSAAGVAADWADYGPLVRPGGLVLFHDIVNEYSAAGVVTFWRELAASGVDCHEITNSSGNPAAYGPAGFGIIRKGP